MRSINSHVCMYCGTAFEMNRLNWLIRERALEAEKIETGRKAKRPENNPSAMPDVLEGKAETDDQAEWEEDDEELGVENPFRTVMTSHFSDRDELGRYFYSRMISSAASGDSSRTLPDKRPMLVRAEYFTDDAGSNQGNSYRTPDGKEIHIFENPSEDGQVSLHFTQDFIESMNRQGYSTLKVRRQFIENQCIRAVCPWCTSFLPDELFQNKQEYYVVKLGFIGPRESGKTTLNVVNILLERLTRGGWSLSKSKYLAVTHYLSNSGGNYYKKVFKTGMFPERTQPLDYVPPLLLRLNRPGGEKHLLLVLMDVAGEFLQGLEQKMAEDDIDERDEMYQRLLNEMDGYLLTMDAERELYPLVAQGQADNGNAEERTVKLQKLMNICASMKQFRNKPAALILTKCDTLFEDRDMHGNGLTPVEFQNLFQDFTPLEQAYWQQPEDADSLDAPYQADRHEFLQFSFKPLIQRRFPTLWALMQCFSRVDVFPESTIGNTQFPMQEIKQYKIDDPYINLKPFHSTDPIFWLLDMMEAEESNEVQKRKNQTLVN